MIFELFPYFDWLFFWFYSFWLVLYTEEGEDWETVSQQSSDDEDYMMLKYQNEEELPAFDKQYG